MGTLPCAEEIGRIVQTNNNEARALKPVLFELLELDEQFFSMCAG